MDYSSHNDFRLIGARVSSLDINEEELLSGGEGEIEFELTTSVSKPRISDFPMGDREVIELSVTITARTRKTEQSHCFSLRCTAGFVGKSTELDGNLDEFEKRVDFYARALYWMTRARMDSVLSVTVLKDFRPLPWELMERPNKPSKKISSKSRGKAAKS